MRTPAMVRWPGKISTSKVPDEIFADLDWYPTLAEYAGAKARIPTDRPMDGYSQAHFLLGRQDKSNRDHVVTFVGTDVWSVKWRYMNAILKPLKVLMTKWWVLTLFHRSMILKTTLQKIMSYGEMRAMRIHG
jgi:arylsulfatase A-like enzyme